MDVRVAVDVEVEDAVGVPVGTDDEVNVGAAVFVDGGIEVFDGLSVFVAVGTLEWFAWVLVLVTVEEGSGVRVFGMTASGVDVETDTFRVKVGSGVEVGDAGWIRGSNVMLGTGVSRDARNVPTRSGDVPVAGMSVIS